jgi:hypothetical protein
MYRAIARVYILTHIYIHSIYAPICVGIVEKWTVYSMQGRAHALQVSVQRYTLAMSRRSDALERMALLATGPRGSKGGHQLQLQFPSAVKTPPLSSPRKKTEGGQGQGRGQRQGQGQSTPHHRQGASSSGSPLKVGVMPVAVMADASAAYSVLHVLISLSETFRLWGNVDVACARGPHGEGDKQMYHDGVAITTEAKGNPAVMLARIMARMTKSEDDGEKRTDEGFSLQREANDVQQVLSREVSRSVRYPCSCSVVYLNICI